MFDTDLESITEALQDRPLSDDEKLKLLDEAKQAFDRLPGVEFEDLSEDDLDNITKDFKTTRNLITKNIDRLEKITGLVFDNIALMPDNLKAIAIGMECINSQNNNIRLLAELKNKVLLNKQLSKKIAGEKDKGGNALPKGFTLK